MSILLNSVEAFRNYSISQNQVSTGQFMHFYKETLKNLCLDYSTSKPNFYYDDYITWSHINIMRTTVLAMALDFTNMLPNIQLPAVRAGAWRIQYKFKTVTNKTQDVFVIPIRPSLINIHYDRKIELSYHHN